MGDEVFLNILKKRTNVSSISFFFFKLPDYLDELGLNVSVGNGRERFFFLILKKRTNVSSISFFFFRLPDYLDEPELRM